VAPWPGRPDIRAALLRSAGQGEVVWAEWHWRGTRRDGKVLDMQGVTFFDVRDDRIAWGRLYMEEIETPGVGIDATVRNLKHRS
jgi:ketosteroid isomerase-like protein